MALKFFLIAFCFLPAFPARSSEKENPSRNSELTRLAKDFVDLLVKKNYRPAFERFDAVMKNAMPPEKIEAVWHSITAKAGAFQEQVSTRMEEKGLFRIVYVTCRFEKGPLDIKVVFNPSGEVTGLWFSPARPSAEYKRPSYAKTDSFREERVTVGSGQWALPGTLSLPVGKGPFPAVILVHGSGPNDRDETIGPNKPFRDLAEGLAAKGIAVLRYDKRTMVHRWKIVLMKNITVKEETVDDALAAASLLRKTEGIDGKKIFVLGHSLGGMLAPRIELRDPELAGLIILAGTTRPLEDVLLEQTEYIFSLDGTLSETETESLEKLKLQVARVKDPQLSLEMAPSELPLGTPASYWLDLRGYNPAEFAKNLKQPLLILQGGRDYQVTAKDFQGWKKHLVSRKNVSFRLYPDLNHLFIAGEGKCTPAEYERPGNVAEKVIEDIANWIRKL